MEKASSCIAVFDSVDELVVAAELLIKEEVPAQHISRVNEAEQEGPVASASLTLAQYLSCHGVPDANVELYLSVVESGASLLIVVGSYRLIEHVGSTIEPLESAFVSLHFA